MSLWKWNLNFLVIKQPNNDSAQADWTFPAVPHLIKDSPGDIPTAQSVIAEGQQVSRVAGREVHAVDLEAVGDEDVSSFLRPAALQNDRSHRHRCWSLKLFILITTTLKAKPLLFECFLEEAEGAGWEETPAQVIWTVRLLLAPNYRKLQLPAAISATAAASPGSGRQHLTHFHPQSQFLLPHVPFTSKYEHTALLRVQAALVTQTAWKQTLLCLLF